MVRAFLQHHRQSIFSFNVLPPPWKKWNTQAKCKNVSLSIWLNKQNYLKLWNQLSKKVYRFQNICSLGLGYNDISFFPYIVWEDSIPLPVVVLTKSECENIYVICRLGGPYGEKLWPRAWKCCLRPQAECSIFTPEVTGFQYRDRP